jgi:mannose-6-phosphate isomerase-like protein (cupin superfamily)
MRGVLTPTPTAADPHLASAPATAACRVRLDDALLEQIAAGIAASPLWQGQIEHDPLARPSIRLVVTESYEVWLIGWSPGQSVELHDHGDAAGAFAVVEGELVEVVVDADRDLRRHVIAVGGSRTVPVGQIHDVLNLSEATATSIHVYSPPLSTMTHYDALTLEPVREERYVADGAVYGPGDAARALHPANGARART